MQRVDEEDAFLDVGAQHETKNGRADQEYGRDQEGVSGRRSEWTTARPGAPDRKSGQNEHTCSGVTLTAVQGSPQKRRHRNNAERAAVHGQCEQRTENHKPHSSRRQKCRTG